MSTHHGVSHTPHGVLTAPRVYALRVTPEETRVDPRHGKVSHALRWTANILQRNSVRLEHFAACRTAQASAIAVHTVRQQNFEHSTQAALQQAVLKQGGADAVSIIAVSIDFIDVVSASHGRDVGEQLFAIAVNRLRDAVRSDDPITKVESGFALLWTPQSSSLNVTDVVSRIAAQFDRPFTTSIGQLIVTASIGVASVSGSACQTTEADSLIRHARSAVMSAQRNGRAQVAFFDRAVQAQVIESYETEHHLRAAIVNNELSVAYQPIVSMRSGAVVAVEALARWRDKTLGLVSPSTFIPIAEESGLINQVGNRVMHDALCQASRWSESEDTRAVMMINLSNRQLLDRNLIATISGLLDEFQLNPQQICLEISESVVMSDVAASMTILGHLKDLGLCLAIDDFGTGYSSLSYLRRLPVDILKIDQSFMHSIYNRDDRLVTKAIIDLAHTLGMTTVAEGVETELQAETLFSLNCDMVQGFLFHHPVPADEVNLGQVDISMYTDPTIGSLGWSSEHAATADLTVRL